MGWTIVFEPQTWAVVCFAVVALLWVLLWAGPLAFGGVLLTRMLWRHLSRHVSARRADAARRATPVVVSAAPPAAVTVPAPRYAGAGG